MKRVWILLAGLALAIASIPVKGWAQSQPLGIGDVLGVKRVWSGDAVNSILDNGKWVYIGTAFSGLWVSSDSGKTFSQRGYAAGLNGRMMALALVDSGNVFAGTDNGIFCSRDNGYSWKQIFWPPPYGSSMSLLFTKDKSILVGTHRGIFRSRDNGNSWSRVADSTTVRTYAWAMTQTQVSGVILVGCNSGVPNTAIGVVRSTDNGDTWTVSSDGLTDKNVSGIAAQGGYSKYIYLVTDMGGAFVSSNEGLTWDSLSVGNKFGGTAFMSPPLGVFLADGFCDNSGNALYYQYGISGWKAVPNLNTGVFSIAKHSVSEIWVGSSSDGLYLVSFNNPTKVEIQDAPTGFSLSQNYPNPFNPSTMIKFDLPNRTIVRLTVYNLVGQEVTTLVDGKLNAGTHSVEWNGSRYPSGVYFCRIETNGFTATKRMLLMK